MCPAAWTATARHSSPPASTDVLTFSLSEAQLAGLLAEVAKEGEEACVISEILFLHGYFFALKMWLSPEGVLSVYLHLKECREPSISPEAVYVKYGISHGGRSIFSDATWLLPKLGWGGEVFEGFTFKSIMMADYANFLAGGKLTFTCKLDIK